MLNTIRPDRPNRILYPSRSWFPLQKDVFETVFPHLRKSRSAHLYMAMYERARRHPSKPFAANLTDLAKMINCDARTVRSCIVELVGEGCVRIVDKGGKLRSRTHKTTFSVVLAAKKLEAGGWFPVLRFLVTDYLRKYNGSLLLIALLHYQHLKWRRDCWVGINTLATNLGLNRRTAFSYLNTMGHEARWKRLGTGLPWPLQISYSPDMERRRFSVRAAQFYIPLGQKKPVVKLREEFAIHFRLQKPQRA